jgi:hypothetical protein
VSGGRIPLLRHGLLSGYLVCWTLAAAGAVLSGPPDTGPSAREILPAMVACGSLRSAEFAGLCSLSFARP